ncbi:MAG: FHA domain-containing protein [Bdellovibrionales bacterium]|nr:FHA domain-containing protein [Bdellovibrionales bacterium]
MKQAQDTAFLDSPIEITIIRDGRPLMNQTFQHSPIQIGRVLDNDIVLPFDSVSRFHCELRFENKKWTLVDLKSMNGMKVNGQQVASATFETGGEFDVKPVTIRFQVKLPHPLPSAPMMSPSQLQVLSHQVMRLWLGPMSAHSEGSPKANDSTMSAANRSSQPAGQFPPLRRRLPLIAQCSISMA